MYFYALCLFSKFGSFIGALFFVAIFKGRSMEDVRRTPFYSTYPEKELPPQEDTLNAYSTVSLMFGLVAVMFGASDLVYC